MNHSIWTFGDGFVKGGLLSFAIHAVVAYVLATVIVKFLNRLSEKAMMLKGRDENDLSLKYISRTLHTVVYIVAALIVLNDVKPFEGIAKAALGASGIVAVVIGLAAQATFGNYIAGFFLAIYQPFKVGDRITLKGQGIQGTVLEITFRHTVIRTPIGTNVIIPNSTLNSEAIEDKTYDGHAYYSSIVEVGVGYETDLKECYKVIERVVEGCELFLDTRSEEDKKNGVPIVRVNFKEFQDSALLLVVPLTSGSVDTINRLCSDVREGILVEFNKAGINIPFPIRTVYMQK